MRRPAPRSPVPIIAGGAALVVALLVAAAPAAGRERLDGPPRPYLPPVEAPVTDPFRPPPTPYAAGNRGLEYATVSGTPVRAAAAGVVTFAGSVAGGLHVTVAHPDGIRTSYSFLASIAVRRGATVGQGQVLGRSGRRLHLGARRGDTYLDPASLWGSRGPPRVALVPLDGAGPTRPPPGRAPRNVM